MWVSSWNRTSPMVEGNRVGQGYDTSSLVIGINNSVINVCFLHGSRCNGDGIPLNPVKASSNPDRKITVIGCLSESWNLVTWLSVHLSKTEDKQSFVSKLSKHASSESLFFRITINSNFSDTTVRFTSSTDLELTLSDVNPVGVDSSIGWAFFSVILEG